MVDLRNIHVEKDVNKTLKKNPSDKLIHRLQQSEAVETKQLTFPLFCVLQFSELVALIGVEMHKYFNLLELLESFKPLARKLV